MTEEASDCNKIVFASKGEANEYAKRFRQGGARHSWRKVKGTWRAYKCRACGMFHLTTMSKAQEVQHRKRLKREGKQHGEHQ